MANYIPKMSDAILIFNDIVILVIAEADGFFFPFVKKQGKLTRADSYIKFPPRIDGLVYQPMTRQVRAIFSSRKKPTDGVVLELATIKPSFHHSLEELDRIKLLAYYNIEIAKNGSLVMHRFRKGKEELKEIVQIFRAEDAIDAAIRAQQHIVDGYKGANSQDIIGEIQKLAGIQEVLQNANNLLCNWHNFSPREIWDMEEKVSAVIESLKHCSNVYKVLVREQMKNFSGIQDSREIVNPPAIAAKTAAAIAKIIRRGDEVDNLFVRNVIKQQALKIEKLHEEMNIKHACLLLKAVIASPDKTLDNYGMIELKINQALDHLRSAWAKPYFIQAEKAQAIINLGKKYCQEKKFNLARLMFSAAITTLD
jgi:hypothetical protein